jgi:alanine racemase
MQFKSAISQTKTIAKGAYVGYNLTWQARRRTRFAIIPVGYADGYDFLLSNRGTVSLRGTLCPVIGKVSMDMICVDITEVKDARIGDEVTLLGGPEPELRAENLAASYGGSSYELLCQVGRRARRYYLENGRILHSAPLSRRDFVSTDYSDSKLSQIIQSAISQRLRDEEIGELISREILRTFFYNKDRDIHYRHNFDHRIRFLPSGQTGYYRSETMLSFDKILQNDYFIVACANSDEALRSYFKRKDVEYRWLMDDNFALDSSSFALSAVSINGIELETRISHHRNCLEIRCSHPDLVRLVGRQVRFEINTITLYPCASHQLSIFITELTRGVKIAFEYPASFRNVETIPVFSGQNKYPRIVQSGNEISVSTKPGEWVFPLSGVVFAY